MKTTIVLLSFISILSLSQCSSESAKKNISKAGDATGQVVGEFVSGMSSGVQKAFDMSIELPSNLSEKGLKLGKITVKNDTEGTDNLLVIYFIFDQDFSEMLTAKVFDRKGLEMGRTKAKVSGKKGDANFIEFHFDKLTNIDIDCKITIE